MIPLCKLIVFEGIDGCGKATQLHKLRNFIESLNIFCSFIKEPNEDDYLGKVIYKMLNPDYSSRDLPSWIDFRRPPLPEFQRMYVVSRAVDVIARIHPILDNQSSTDNVILMERYALSTIAYGMLDPSRTADDYIKLHRAVIGDYFMRWPDVSYILDISADEAIRRISKRSTRSENDFFEKKELLAKIRTNYLELAKRKDIGDVMIVDGTRSAEEIFADILDDFKTRYLTGRIK